MATLFLNFICCDISEKKELIVFVFGTAINHNTNKDLTHVEYTLALCPNLTFMSIIS